MVLLASLLEYQLVLWAAQVQVPPPLLEQREPQLELGSMFCWALSRNSFHLEALEFAWSGWRALGRTVEEVAASILVGQSVQGPVVEICSDLVGSVDQEGHSNQVVGDHRARNLDQDQRDLEVDHSLCRIGQVEEEGRNRHIDREEESSAKAEGMEIRRDWEEGVLAMGLVGDPDCAVVVDLDGKSSVKVSAMIITDGSM